MAAGEPPPIGLMPIISMPAMGGAGAAPAFIPCLPPGFIFPIPIATGRTAGGVAAGIPDMGAAVVGGALFASEACSWVTFACSSASCWVSAGSPAGASVGMVPAAT